MCYFRLLGAALWSVAYSPFLKYSINRFPSFPAYVGSHHQFRHPVRKGRVTVIHPRKDFDIKTLKSMEKQSGLKLF